MSKVFASVGAGAAVYIFADDHCPPHVHARHRGEGWVARVRFSYAIDAVHLISVVPQRNAPPGRTLGLLLDDIAAALPRCRLAWWETRAITCLENRWVQATQAGMVEGMVELLPGRERGATQVREARYDPEAERVMLRLGDGTTLDIRAGGGVER